MFIVKEQTRTNMFINETGYNEYQKHNYDVTGQKGDIQVHNGTEIVDVPLGVDGSILSIDRNAHTGGVDRIKWIPWDS